jgi:DNA-binding response OmpR family regulator
VALILLVDDEPLITDSLTYSLKREGFDVEAVADGHSALDAVENLEPDLVVLDLMLPDISGFEVCRRLRTRVTTPVIMLTAKGEEIDRVLGLEVGADDYLAKPFSFRELLARIQALLRRVQLDRQVSQPQNLISLRQLNMDPEARRVFKDEEELQLSAREFDLLAILMKNAGRAMGRDELIKLVWGDDWVGDPRTLDVHIRWLRLKIEEDPASPEYIQTVRGFGYRFAGPEELN